MFVNFCAHFAGNDGLNYHQSGCTNFVGMIWAWSQTLQLINYAYRKSTIEYIFKVIAPINLSFFKKIIVFYYCWTFYYFFLRERGSRVLTRRTSSLARFPAVCEPAFLGGGLDVNPDSQNGWKSSLARSRPSQFLPPPFSWRHPSPVSSLNGNETLLFLVFLMFGNDSWVAWNRPLPSFQQHSCRHRRLCLLKGNLKHCKLFLERDPLWMATLIISHY